MGRTHLLYTWFLPRPASKELNLPKLKNTSGVTVLNDISYVNCCLNRYLTYRTSHGKVDKVIWLYWGYRFWYLLIFGVLCIHGLGPFMPSSSVFIQLMLCALYRMINKHAKNVFWKQFSNFLFQGIRFLMLYGFLLLI